MHQEDGTIGSANSGRPGFERFSGRMTESSCKGTMTRTETAAGGLPRLMRTDSVPCTYGNFVGFVSSLFIDIAQPPRPLPASYTLASEETWISWMLVLILVARDLISLGESTVGR